MIKNRALVMLKALILGYAITVVMLLILSLVLFKLDISNVFITAGIIITYAVACFIGGVFVAKREKSRKLLWGILFGVIYFTLLAIVSAITNLGESININELIRALVVCIAAGAVGGFASP